MPILQWYKRDEDLTKSARAPYCLLEPVPSLHYGDEDSSNMLIEGDNLDALKALLPYYAGQVQCIYIDPPYNTRSAFFEHYDDNLEHAQWLSMMYPRLELLRDLLAESGSIWVHLDDNEAHYAKVLLDEVMGRTNFVADISWQKSYAVRSNAEFFSTSVEHMLVYCRRRESFRPNRAPRSTEQTSRFSNPDNDPRGPWQSITFTISLVSGARGRQFAKTGRSENVYEVRSPSGKAFLPPPRRCWARTEHVFRALDADKRIWWGARGNGAPRLKMFLSESKAGVIPTTLWANGEEYGFNQDGIRELRALGIEFPTPKPEKLMKAVLSIATNEGELVLDSFLGSGTTAAVAHKMGRRWIGLEMGAHARTHCHPRLKQTVDGEGGGVSKDVGWKGGGGFRFYKLGPPVFDESGRIRDGIKFEHLAAHGWFSETGIARSTRAKKVAFLGEHGGIGYYLLYNGILGDKSPGGGNVLTKALLRRLEPFDGPRVMYGEACQVPSDRLRELGIVFKQTPYDIKAR